MCKFYLTNAGLLIFLALGALGGGAALIADPTGTLVNFPVEMLEGSPFNTYFLPGLILFTVLGIVPAVTAAIMMIWKNRVDSFGLRVVRSISVLTGVNLLIWILVQIVVIDMFLVVHAVYLAAGAAIIFSAMRTSGGVVPAKKAV